MKFLRMYIIVAILAVVPNSQVVGWINRDKTPHMTYANQYIGFNEVTNRNEIKELIGVDPVQTEWCAAFVNAILHKTGFAGSEIVSEHPLLARSFLDWGQSIDVPEFGDVVIFKRGNKEWQGHVGFYVGETEVNGKKFYQILGGNQKNEINISLYPSHRLIGIKRATKNCCSLKVIN